MLALTIMAGFASALGIFQTFPPLGNALRQQSFNLWPNEIPSLPDLIVMRYKDDITEAEYYDHCRKQGFGEDIASRLYQSGGVLLTAGDFISAWRRGLITEDTLNIKLKNLKYDENDLDLIKQVSQYFPAVPDLVRFAVREVYSPTIVEQFGQLEDLPEKFIIEAAKAGLDKDQAENFWASHWELPSARQGFEMLHRGFINEENLKLLLKALDIMPFWRDKLINLSYNPLTRVDVRRMYRLGVMGEEGVYNSYLDLGYSPENADLMTSFTKRFESQEDAGLSRSAVIKAFKEELISITDLQGYLELFGYTPEVVTFWLTMATFERDKDLIDDSIDNLLTLYRMGDISIDQVRGELTALDLPSSFVNSMIVKEKEKLSKKRKLPTQKDLSDWLELEIIHEGEFFDRMSMLGYKDDDIRAYLTEKTFVKEVPKIKYLPITTYVRWTVTDIMTVPKFQATAQAMEIKPDDIESFLIEIDEAKKKLEGVEE